MCGFVKKKKHQKSSMLFLLFESFLAKRINHSIQVDKTDKIGESIYLSDGAYLVLGDNLTIIEYSYAEDGLIQKYIHENVSGPILIIGNKAKESADEIFRINPHISKPFIHKNDNETFAWDVSAILMILICFIVNLIVVCCPTKNEEN